MKINLSSRLAKNNLILVFVNILIIVIFILIYPDSLNYGIINSFLSRLSEVVVLALGVTIVFIGGGFDLSFPSAMALSGVLTAVLYTNGMPFIVAIILGLLSGIVIGIVNSLLIVGLNLDPFITTFAVSIIIRSIVYGISGGATLGNFPAWFNNISKITVLKVPLLFIIMLVLAIASYLLLKRTVLGRYIFVTGGNEKAAKLSGIYINKIKFFLYIIAGFFGAISGLMLSSRVNSAPPNTGLYIGLEVVTAVVVGGTLLTGGVGSILGSILGVSTMVLLLTMFSMLGINPYWEITALGLILIIVVGYDKTINTIKNVFSKSMQRSKISMKE